MTIVSTSASTCNWIDHEADKLRNKIDWLQQKVENVGAVPVVKRCIVHIYYDKILYGDYSVYYFRHVHSVIRNISRASASGQANLRKLLNDVTKLGEQLCDLGLSHILSIKK